MTFIKSLVVATAMTALVGGTACVTINVYFPAAAAEQAADKIIEEVWGEGTGKAATGKSSKADAIADGARRVARLFVDWLIPAAHAQQANLDISSPAIGKIEASLKARHAQLLPYLNSGAVGLTADGLVAVRDAKSIALNERKTVNQLVADDNRDRAALYREIAAANGHPEWESQIQATFARRWIDRAQSGWYYQSSDGWKAK